MNKKVCGKCGNYYDENLLDCPICNKGLATQEFNVKNVFLNMDKKEENVEDSNIQHNSLFTDNSSLQEIDDFNRINNEYKDFNSNNYVKSNIITEESSRETEEITQVKKAVKKKRKKSINKYYSYFVLILSMILLFIVVISSLNDFNIPILLHYSATILSLIVVFNLTYIGDKKGFYVALISSILLMCMIIEADYISALIGVYLFTYSFAYLIKNR